MEIHLISYYIGILIIFITNILILIYNKSYNIVNVYVYFNIFGAFLIAYYFMYKEKYIKF